MEPRLNPVRVKALIRTSTTVKTSGFTISARKKLPALFVGSLRENRIMKKNKTPSFASYWRNAVFESAFYNIDGVLFWAIKRQAQKAYNAGRKHQKLKTGR